MATNYIPQHNSDCEVSAIGKIVFNKGEVQNGIRFTPATATRQAVVNVKLAFTRSYKKAGEETYTKQKSYTEFALWGQRAEGFYNSIIRYGEIQAVLKSMDIRVRAFWSLADQETKIWGEPQKADIIARASGLELTHCEPSNFGDQAEMPAGAMIQAPAEIEEVAL